MNRSLLTLIFVALLYQPATAQIGQKIYFNGYNQSDSAHADHYRVITSGNPDLFTYTDYYNDGTCIRGTGAHGFITPARVGEEKHYYKSGKLAIVYHYSSTSALISATGFYPNGVMMYIEFPRAGFPFRLINYDADSSGHVHIINGNGRRHETDSVVLPSCKIEEYFTIEGPYKNGMRDGVWRGDCENSWRFEEEYKEGRLVAGISQTPQGKKFRYVLKVEYPDFGGGLDDFEHRIIPLLKNKNDTTGLVFIKPGYLRLSYEVDEKGRIINVKGIRKTDHTRIDIELKRPLPAIEPMKIRGVPIAFMVADNRDYFIRGNFKVSPFQTDLPLNLQYKPATQ